MKPTTTIDQFADEIHATACANGWHETPPIHTDGSLNVDRVGAWIALAHSELSEALEEVRLTCATLSDVRTIGDDAGKPVGFPIEMADAVIRVLDTCRALGVDIGAALAIKAAYNKTRTHRHGGKAL